MPQREGSHLKIKRVSMVDQVCDKIKSLMMSGSIKSGEKLPAEAELASTFGVNRLTVRLALQKLSTIGVIETRVGEGSFVREFTFSNYLNEISDVYLSAVQLEEICALRKLIELESAKLSICNATEAQTQQLRERLDLYLQAAYDYHHCEAACAEQRLAELVECDLDFHYQICCNSHNTLFRDLFVLLRPLIKEHLASLLVRRNREWVQQGLPEGRTDSHEDLYRSIEQKDWGACKKIYLEIIDFQQQASED